MSVTITDVCMPGMFAIKEDYETNGGQSELESDAYWPMSYGFGEPCEACWLTAKLDEENVADDWIDFNGMIRSVGGDGCPHEGAS